MRYLDKKYPRELRRTCPLWFSWSFCPP